MPYMHTDTSDYYCYVMFRLVTNDEAFSLDDMSDEDRRRIILEIIKEMLDSNNAGATRAILQVDTGSGEYYPPIKTQLVVDNG